MQKIKLSIIVVSYESRGYLEKCLASIFAKIDCSMPFEVIVVNNGAKEDVDGLEGTFLGIKIIQNSRNSGFGSANNLGARAASGEIIFFLNPDAEIISQNIALVIREFESDPDLGILGSRLIESTGNVQKWSVGAKISLWSILRNNLKKTQDEKYWQSRKKVEVFWVAGTALFVRRAVFLQLDGFDEQFFAYFEDADLCNRAHFFDKKVVYFPEFSVLHHGGKSFLVKKEQKKSYYASQDYYFQKHLGFFQTRLLKLLRIFSF
jgi:hypothetical protein